MHNHNLTYNDLFLIDRDIEKQMATSPAFRFFNAEKIRRFKGQNNLRLGVLYRTIDGLAKKYALHDENDKAITQEVNGERMYTFLNEENEKAYKEEAEKFLSITIQIF